MKKNRLGKTDIWVSNMCLGSMTWGSQNDASEGHAQIAMALDHGVNFIDTAEMYPVNPIKAETVGRTERIIGLWLEESNRRHDIVLATKHSGEGFEHARQGEPISPKTIPEAVEGSLRRLKTDYIDLYQFHWPNRGSYMFRKNWQYNPKGNDRDEVVQNMEDCMGALQTEVEKGRIRAFGLSNESAWGTTQWIEAAKRTGGPRPASVQNEYSMMCRLFDTDMSEACVLESVGLLAFTPLAAGLLSGKYQNDQIPEGSRMSINPDLGGRKTPRAFQAAEGYLKIAKKYGLDPSQMALAFCLTRPFMTSVIFGATHLSQLENAMKASDLRLNQEVRNDIDIMHAACPMPF